VPLQKQISDEVLLRYNGMLISTFELLEQSRAQIESVQNYLDALHDFWVAEAELNSTLQGTGASMSSRGRNNE
jgi:outer membrane protein TolC